MSLHSRTVSRILRAGILPVLLALVLSIIVVSQVTAQTYSLADARSAFGDGNYDEAIEMLSTVARDPSSLREEKRKAFELLGRAYLAIDMLEDARAAIQSLIELPPPTEALDPDLVPVGLMEIWYDACKEVDCLDDEEPDGNIRTVAVLDFTNNSPGPDGADWDAMSLGFATMLITNLTGGVNLKIVERERIQWILKELELQQKSKNMDPATAVRIGKLIGAQSVILGGFWIIGKDFWLGTRFVNVETSEVLDANKVEGKWANMPQLVQDLAVQIAATINTTIDEASIDVTKRTQSADAMFSYAQGLDFEGQGSYTAAYNKYMQAYEYDSGYSQALVRAEIVKPQMN
ncbi:MAG: hypothetical protein BMS9Abin05_2239 [Rhodothermia bacterium]|nr:MAG: hypothetical protein BMS9Abin05_2239 [Rhodothermia bacterium]